jgi:hypothetical protein
MLEPIRAAIERESFRVPARRVTVHLAALGPDVVLAGAQPVVADRGPGAGRRPARPSDRVAAIA